MTDSISGDEVIELVLNGLPADREELRGYWPDRKNLHYKRRWFTTLEDAAEVFPRL